MFCLDLKTFSSQLFHKRWAIFYLVVLVLISIIRVLSFQLAIISTDVWFHNHCVWRQLISKQNTGTTWFTIQPKQDFNQVQRLVCNFKNEISRDWLRKNFFRSFLDWRIQTLILLNRLLPQIFTLPARKYKHHELGDGKCQRLWKVPEILQKDLIDCVVGYHAI